MNVRCPQCQTVYRVDPAKVPGRVRARCATCPGILTVVPPADESPPVPEPALHERLAVPVSRPFAQPRPAATVDDAETQQPKRPAAPVFRPTPGMPLQAAPVARPARPVRFQSPATHESGRRSATAVASAATAHPNPFLAEESADRGRRLALALVSDMVVYDPEKRAIALRDGTLKAAFEREIRETWHEYVQQMGEQFATSTPYFTDALNEILAEGKQIF